MHAIKTQLESWGQERNALISESHPYERIGGKNVPEFKEIVEQTFGETVLAEAELAVQNHKMKIVIVADDYSAREVVRKSVEAEWRRRFAGGRSKMSVSMTLHELDEVGNSFESIQKLLKAKNFQDADYVIAIGGCGCLDAVLTACVAQTTAPLVMIPSIVSANCWGGNRYIVGSGTNHISALGATAHRVVLSLTALQTNPRSQNAFTGFLDYQAQISTRLDTKYGFRAGEPQKGIDIQYEKFIETDYKPSEEWLVTLEPAELYEGQLPKPNEVGQRDTPKMRMGPLKKMLEWQIDYFKQSYVANANFVGTEHQFYYNVCELHDVRMKSLTHSQIVMIGVLLSVWFHGKETGSGSQERFFNLANAVKRNGGLPQMVTENESLTQWLETKALTTLVKQNTKEFKRKNPQPDSLLMNLGGLFPDETIKNLAQEAVKKLTMALSTTLEEEMQWEPLL